MIGNGLNTPKVWYLCLMLQRLAKKFIKLWIRDIRSGTLQITDDSQTYYEEYIREQELNSSTLMSFTSDPINIHRTYFFEFYVCTQ